MASPEFLTAREQHLRATGQEHLLIRPPKPNEPLFDPETLTGRDYMNFLAEHPSYEPPVQEHAAQFRPPAGRRGSPTSTSPPRPAQPSETQ